VIDVVVSALINSTDETVQFLLHNPIDALLAVEVSHKEYLLVFASKWCGSANFLHFFRGNINNNACECICFCDGL